MLTKSPQTDKNEMSTQLKFITTLWSVDQRAQLITTNDSRVHKMKNNEHKNVDNSCGALVCSVSIIMGNGHPVGVTHGATSGKKSPFADSP